MPLGRFGALIGTLAIVLGLAVPGATRAATDFPAGFTGFHTYPEIGAATLAVATAHPDIARRFSLGTSYQGRQIWAMKISDHVQTDEIRAGGPVRRRPPLGRAHGSRDGAADHALAGGRLRRRPPDHPHRRHPRDLARLPGRSGWRGVRHLGGHFHYWRKNRQPTPGSSYVGTDLNRNYGYHWGGGGKTSTNPHAITYRGPAAFSAPETRAFRDFLASRVVGGRQQIRAAITFHEYGRLVMWPYGYTTTDVPPDMTQADHDALKAIGKHLASTNGYRPEQGSDMYVTSGTTRDFEYGTYRIFSYTFEMSTGDYVDNSVITSETGRNKEAVLYLMERAWCPLGTLGAADDDRALRCLRRRPRSRSRLDARPGRDRHRHVGLVQPQQPGSRRPPTDRSSSGRSPPAAKPS